MTPFIALVLFLLVPPLAKVKGTKALVRAHNADNSRTDVKWDQWGVVSSATTPDQRGTKTKQNERKVGTVEEIQIGDPPSKDQKGVSETLSIDSETSSQIDESISGESKAAKIDSKAMAMETLKLAKEYAQLHVSRQEPPSPTRVKAFLALYGLPFRYGNGPFVPYCASGVGFAAARAHYRLAWPKDHPGDTKHADPGDDYKQLRQALPDVTRDYCKTHPSTIFMMNAAKARKYPNGKSFWVARGQRPMKGWLVFFNWTRGKNPQHVGIVDAIDTKGTTLSTVEFNTSKDNPSNGGRVVAKQRNVRYVVGYIRTYP
jgi:YD repeat-containing protein